MTTNATNSKEVGFNAVFQGVNTTKRRYRVLFGSAGSGKSVNIAQDFVIKLADPMNEGMNLLVVRGGVGRIKPLFQLTQKLTGRYQPSVG